MVCGYIKIFMALVVPIVVALLYAKQVQLQDDIRAVEWDVQHPPDLRWTMDHPRECLQRDRAQARYLHQLLTLD